MLHSYFKLRLSALFYFKSQSMFLALFRWEFANPVSSSTIMSSAILGPREASKFIASRSRDVKILTDGVKHTAQKVTNVLLMSQMSQWVQWVISLSKFGVLGILDESSFPLVFVTFYFTLWLFDFPHVICHKRLLIMCLPSWFGIYLLYFCLLMFKQHNFY